MRISTANVLICLTTALLALGLAFLGESWWWGLLLLLGIMSKSAKAPASSVPEDLIDLLEQIQGEWYVPDRNCSCFAAPPCGDCVQYSGAREVLERVDAYLRAAEGTEADAS